METIEDPERTPESRQVLTIIEYNQDAIMAAVQGYLKNLKNVKRPRTDEEITKIAQLIYSALLLIATKGPQAAAKMATILLGNYREHLTILNPLKGIEPFLNSVGLKIHKFGQTYNSPILYDIIACTTTDLAQPQPQPEAVSLDSKQIFYITADSDDHSSAVQLLVVIPPSHPLYANTVNLRRSLEGRVYCVLIVGDYLEYDLFRADRLIPGGSRLNNVKNKASLHHYRPLSLAKLIYFSLTQQLIDIPAAAQILSLLPYETVCKILNYIPDPQIRADLSTNIFRVTRAIRHDTSTVLGSTAQTASPNL
ncbi:hypothetical protein CO045_01535 [Candidatus Peregrinibacteria bacterium CG_4_9_14_0_2_um_filter_41_14]|nr:MAG: hypothetical protein CO045_01535 [Candidatus Peregrinibacteria bacterium CG_4_9_14_0_2_um_filter_41_14]